MVARIINYRSDQFPTGSIAYHPNFSYCSIVKCKGNKRVITYQDTHAERLTFRTRTVTVSELQSSLC